ncbi:MAG: VTT domain-containing protein [Chloroflexi bacterium]|nr:VTT domain-containing protein [Chloroflexota bacterium]
MSDLRPTEAAVDTRAKPAWLAALPRLLVLLLIVGLTMTILLNREQLRRVAGYGYPGVFLISLLGNATIIMPAPSIAVVFAMGATLNPLLVGLAAGVGGALGELTGYVAGATGRAVIEDRDLYQRVVGWTRRFGLIAIFVLSIVPNPFFDIVGMAAGVLKVPLWQFLLVTWVGKTIKTVATAYMGAGSLAILGLS